MRKLKSSKWIFESDGAKVIAEVDYERKTYNVLPCGNVGEVGSMAFTFLNQRAPNPKAGIVARLIAEACAQCEQEIAGRDHAGLPTKVVPRHSGRCGGCGKEASTNLDELRHWHSYSGDGGVLCPDCRRAKGMLRPDETADPKPVAPVEPAEPKAKTKPRYCCVTCGKVLPADLNKASMWSKAGDGVLCPKCEDAMNKAKLSSALENSK